MSVRSELDRCLILLGFNITLIGGLVWIVFVASKAITNEVLVDGLTAAGLTIALGSSAVIIRRSMLRLLAGLAFLVASFVIALARMKITVGGTVVDNIHAVWYLVPAILSGLYALSALFLVKLELRSQKPV